MDLCQGWVQVVPPASYKQAKLMSDLSEKLDTYCQMAIDYQLKPPHNGDWWSKMGNSGEHSGDFFTWQSPGRCQ